MSNAAPSLVAVGKARYANLSVAKALTDAASAGDTLPARANYAIISVKDQAVWMTFDAVTATAANGAVYLPAGTVLTLENCRTLLANISMLEASATATVTVAYFEGDK